MRRSFVLLCLPLLVAADPIKVAVDPHKAGPDYPYQGEYLGETISGEKIGAEVVARGDGNFLVNLLPGGLRGDGGDYAKRSEGKGWLKEGQVGIEGKDNKWAAHVRDGQMIGSAPDGRQIQLKHVIRTSPTMGAKPPAGALILFDGTSTDEWTNAKIVDGNLLGANVTTKKLVRDFAMHLEFRLSFMPFATGQSRSNSGVYIQRRYEVQVLDSFGLKGANNECGGIYTLAAPKVNMCYPPLQWQTYDIEFASAKFEGVKKVSDATLTVRHNGVVVHDKVALKNGPTGGGRAEADTPGPIYLQSHSGQVQYRNIWIVENK